MSPRIIYWKTMCDNCGHEGFSLTRGKSKCAICQKGIKVPTPRGTVFGKGLYFHLRQRHLTGN
jgi:hypothetical protein